MARSYWQPSAALRRHEIGLRLLPRFPSRRPCQCPSTCVSIISWPSSLGGSPTRTSHAYSEGITHTARKRLAIEAIPCVTLGSIAESRLRGLFMRGLSGQHRTSDELEGGPSWPAATGSGTGVRAMRRGRTPQILLGALLDGPAHGYEIMRRLEERSAGIWRPSDGSVYPALHLLEAEGLVASHENHGKRVYNLTAEGQAQAVGQAPGSMPWETAERSLSGRQLLHGAMVQLQLAARHVAISADDVCMKRATGILGEARQKLYLLLAEDSDLRKVP